LFLLAGIFSLQTRSARRDAQTFSIATTGFTPSGHGQIGTAGPMALTRRGRR
jgi:hypothetical protein